MGIFSGILGHEIPKRFFKNFIEDRNTMPHSLLLKGPPGVGKFALALDFARTFNCLKEGKPGCECLHCHQINLGTFSDLFVSSSDSEIKAEHMRGLIRDVLITPRVATNRLVIIDEFDRINETAANIFLKTLEEPPNHLVFLLCTSKPESLLPTIRSRCIPIEFRAGQPSEVAKELTSIFPDADSAVIQRASATGCFGTEAREVHADLMSTARAGDDGGEPFGQLLEAFVDGLLMTDSGEFAHHLKGALQTLISSVEGRRQLKGIIPKGLDIYGLKRFLKDELPPFSPINYLLEEGGKQKKIGEYDKGKILLNDLTQELYSRLVSLKPKDGKTRLRLLQYMATVREIGADLEGNRNIELSFEKLLASGKVSSPR